MTGKPCSQFSPAKKVHSLAKKKLNLYYGSHGNNAQQKTAAPRKAAQKIPKGRNADRPLLYRNSFAEKITILLRLRKSA